MSITPTQSAAPAPLVKASTQLAQFLGIEPGMMLETVKAQCFKGTPAANVTDAQLAAFVSVAAALKLNPLLPGNLYAYPERNGGVQVMIGPDGVFQLLASNPDIVAEKDHGMAWWVEYGTEGNDTTCTAFIHHRAKGIIRKKIYLSEWKVSSNPNWNTRPKHMMEIRALKQAARQIIHGIPMDEDERKIAEMLNVTPSAGSDPAAPAGETITEKIQRKRGRPPGSPNKPAAEAPVEPDKPATLEAEIVPEPDAFEPDPAPAPDAATEPEPAPTLQEPAPLDEAARSALITSAQDEMLNRGVSETKLFAYAQKIAGMVPAGCKSVWELPTATIEKLAKVIPALSVGRTPAVTSGT